MSQKNKTKLEQAREEYNKALLALKKAELHLVREALIDSSKPTAL
jgi:hypothetical protein